MSGEPVNVTPDEAAKWLRGATSAGDATAWAIRVVLDEYVARSRLIDHLVAVHSRCDSAAKALLMAVESPDRAIYLDECAALREALGPAAPPAAS